ncbi:hypothetical protein [Azospirillum rugosum]|uniref:Uncharacterized protein n=1 Tax=Azospirillum rugosum TaxID=416170 RepID=A0ABS4STL7_9PROT|nr:hypothetical protein [Azospirillum rugosum]MBP2295904.1 hypothetical protein [Azospirillum rugosum]MDQ0530161.1 hypothetical protein [Azospirillum rugosum]
MDDSFIAKPLGQRQIDQAYPLVRAVAPDLRVEQWRAFAAVFLAPKESSAAPSGIMTVQNTRGYIHGLYSFTIEQSLRHGRILAVTNFVVLDLFDMTGPAETLLRSMEGLARGHSCAAIHTTLLEGAAAEAGSQRSLLGCFQSEGHRPDALRLCKPLDGANDNKARPRPSDARDAERPL